MDKDTNATLGQRIRGAREAAGLSLRQLASLADVPHPTIARLERDEVEQPIPTYIQRIADVLELDTAELLACIGVNLPTPKPRAYFRKAYGMSEAEARQAVELIEQHFGKKNQGDEASNHTEGGDL